MDHETESSIRAATDQILKEVRLVGAVAEILALFEGMGGPVNLEPDSLGVIGAEIASRVAGLPGFWRPSRRSVLLRSGKVNPRCDTCDTRCIALVSSSSEILINKVKRRCHR
jgi:hypothetical protein